MSFIEGLIGNRIRKEMKTRIDLILKAEAEWSETAKKLIEALDRLTEAVEAGNSADKTVPIDRSIAVSQGARRLAKDTKRLVKAVKSHRKTLEKISAKIG